MHGRLGCACACGEDAGAGLGRRRHARTDGGVGQTRRRTLDAPDAIHVWAEDADARPGRVERFKRLDTRMEI
jgi:hypothetical protein